MKNKTRKLFLIYRELESILEDIKNEIIRTENYPQFFVTGLEPGEVFDFKPGAKYQAKLINNEHLNVGFKDSGKNQPVEIYFNDDWDNDFFYSPYNVQFLKKNAVINVRKSDRVKQRLQLNR